MDTSSTQNEIVLFWFRRDLRFEDNIGFFHALTSGKEVLPLFIYDTNIIHSLPLDDARLAFIQKRLSMMQEVLTPINKILLCKKGTPSEIFIELIEKYSITAVYCNEDYEPYARQRDLEIKKICNAKGVSFFSFRDHVIFSPTEVLKTDGTHYQVFTPYSKSWMQSLELEQERIAEVPSKMLLHKCVDTQKYYSSNDHKIIFESTIKVPEPRLSTSLMQVYAEKRDFPVENVTTLLGPHLRFGTVSIRSIVRNWGSLYRKFLLELIWREFFIQVMYFRPDTEYSPYRMEYNGFPYENKESLFNAWKEGNTGFPLIDAGMRELNTTGNMHNRVRMLVASFLCKDLLIDWKWGERYFAEKLLDFELASNVGNWQWAAGCGCDAAPYFRVFNPDTQAKKFDPESRYIKKWVPEFQSSTYKPIVDHKVAREKVLSLFKIHLGRNT